MSGRRRGGWPARGRARGCTSTLDRWSPFVSTDGRQLRVSATLEPVYELKGFTRIGFRMIRRVIAIANGRGLSSQAIAELSAADLLRVDLATIARGMRAARGRRRRRAAAQPDRPALLRQPVQPARPRRVDPAPERGQRAGAARRDLRNPGHRGRARRRALCGRVADQTIRAQGRGPHHRAGSAGRRGAEGRRFAGALHLSAHRSAATWNSAPGRRMPCATPSGWRVPL